MEQQQQQPMRAARDCPSDAMMRSIATYFPSTGAAAGASAGAAAGAGTAAAAVDFGRGAGAGLLGGASSTSTSRAANTVAMAGHGFSFTDSTRSSRSLRTFPTRSSGSGSAAFLPLGIVPLFAFLLLSSLSFLFGCSRNDQSGQSHYKVKGALVVVMGTQSSYAVGDMADCYQIGQSSYDCYQIGQSSYAVRDMGDCYQKNQSSYAVMET